jgi:glucosamine-6-phosphate deaminase
MGLLSSESTTWKKKCYFVSVEIVVLRNYEQVSEQAARVVSDAMQGRPTLSICLPTGNTPRGMYRLLIRMYREKRLDFSRVIFFMLDEYVGLRSDHPYALRASLWREFLNFVNVRRANVYMPDESYEETIRRVGGIDLLICGIGVNGHLAFNEPGSPLDSRTRVVELTDSSIESIKGNFTRDELPNHALTVGLGTILDAHRVVMLASGSRKASALSRALTEEISPSIPASVLRLHSNAMVIADEDAAALYRVSGHQEKVSQ